MSNPGVSSSQYFGINASDWQSIAIDAASLFCPVVDIYRGGRELFFDEKADKFNAALKLGFGLMGTIPMLGVASRFFVRGGNLVLRAANEMSVVEKLNKVAGIAQYCMTPLFLGGSIMGGIHAIEGMGQWSQLNSKERAEVLTTGLFTFGMPALGLAHGYFARKRSEAVLRQHRDLDYLNMNLEQRGPFPSKTRAPLDPYLYEIEQDIEAGTMTISYPINKDKTDIHEASPRRKAVGFLSMLRWAYEGTLQAMWRDDMALVKRFVPKFDSDIAAKMAGVKGVYARGTNYIIKNQSYIVCTTNHERFLDSVAVRRPLDEIFDLSFAVKESVAMLPGIGKTVGLASWFSGRRVFPVMKSGEGVKQQLKELVFGDGMAQAEWFLKGRDESKVRNVVKKILQYGEPIKKEEEKMARAVLFLGPGTRTVKRQGDTPRTIWGQGYGAFNLSVKTDTPVLPMSFYYEDGWVKTEFYAPMYPRHYRQEGMSDKDVAREMKEAFEKLIREKIVGDGTGYFTEFDPRSYHKVNVHTRTSALGGA